MKLFQLTSSHGDLTLEGYKWSISAYAKGYVRKQSGKVLDRADRFENSRWTVIFQRLIWLE